MKRNMKKWIYDIACSMNRKIMPLMTLTGIGITGSSVKDVVKNGEKQYECIKALADKYDTAAAITVMDLSVEAEVFGSPVSFSDMDIPTISSGIVTDIESVEALKVPEVEKGRTFEFIKAARLAAENIKDRPVFGGETGPFSLAARLYDLTEIMIAIMLEPELVHSLLNKTTEFLINFAKEYKKSGANGIIISEPAAGLLSPAQCNEFSSVYVKKIVEEIQDDSFIVIIHNCGNTRKLVPSLLSTGALGFHFGNVEKMTDIMPQIPWGRFAAGNIDPAGILKNGKVDDVKLSTWELLQKTAIYRNFILSSGCDIPIGTPSENINAMFETLKRFNAAILQHAG